MTVDLTNDDRGKTVVNDNERIGVVTDVEGDRVYVDPEWNHVDEELAGTFGWSEDDDAHYVDTSAVTDVRNGQVHLRDNL